MYLSPNSFPHLAKLSEKERNEVLDSCHSSLSGIYFAGIICVVLFAGSIAKSLMDAVGSGPVASISVSIVVVILAAVVLNLVYVNRYLYTKTKAKVKERIDES